MMNTDAINDSKAKLIISELVKSSVRHFLIAPGSRSTPLALVASENPLAKTIVHFDERGLAFTALGIAKSTQNPVCLICTSGTALANFYPAIIEASLSFTPLILLTADRPSELRDIGATQTIDQVKIFGNYLRWEIDLSCSDSSLPDDFLSRAINQASFRARNSPAGPVLINVMIREPLFVPGKRKLSQEDSHPLPQTTYYLAERHLKEDELATIASDLSKYEKGIIVVGHLPPSPHLDSIFALAMKLQWPIFADAFSGVRSLGRDSSLLSFYNHLLQATYSNEKMLPDAVLYLGGHIISKTLLKWLKASNPKKFTHVSNFPGRHDPNHQVTDRVECDPAQFCQNVSFFLKGRPPSIWLSIWKEYSLHIEEVLANFFEESDVLSEPHTVFSLLKAPIDSFPLFFSTSLPVRYADSFFFPKEPAGPTFANRGACGIDGIIASAIGVAEGLHKPIFAFIGDLCFLHDLNSLALAKELSLPITFIVLNNSGGGIFQFLPIAEHQKFLDKFVVAKHSIKMEGFAKAFDIPYVKPTTLSDYQKVLQTPQLQIVEVESNGKENYLFHQQIEQYIKKRMVKSKKERSLYATI